MAIPSISASLPLSLPFSITASDLSLFHARHFSSISTAHFTRDFLNEGALAYEAGGDAETEMYGGQWHGGEEQEEEEEEEDDGLGYYPDGVKRTLTDEQIEIFRFSELRRLEEEKEGEREREKEKEGKATSAAASPPDRVENQVGELEDGELEDDENTDAASSTAAGPSLQISGTATALGHTSSDSVVKQNHNRHPRSKKSKKVQKAKEKGWFKHQIKPDLRKRTWDKVDTTGSEGLQYGDEEEAAGKVFGPMKPDSEPESRRRRVVYSED